MNDLEKINKVLNLSNKQWAQAAIQLSDVRRAFIQDINDMVEHKYNVPLLFWTHKDTLEWQLFINALSTPLQREMLADCPMTRDNFLQLNRNKKTRIDGLPLFLWWKKWRERQIASEEIANVYEIAQKNIHSELFSIVREFKVNVDDGGIEASSRCKLPEAQIDFPKAIHRKLYNDLARGIVQPSQFKNIFFDSIEYIKKYKPKYDSKATGCVFSGGYFVNPSGSDVAQ